MFPCVLSATIPRRSQPSDANVHEIYSNTCLTAPGAVTNNMVCHTVVLAVRGETHPGSDRVFDRDSALENPQRT